MLVPSVLLLAGLVSTVQGDARRCQVCKTARALELFSNLLCDDVPATAPDCALLGRGSNHDFHMTCPPHSKCLTISNQEEELRTCTQKPQVGTLETTTGVVMTVCDANMCNAAGRLPPPLLTLAALLTLMLSVLSV